MNKLLILLYYLILQRIPSQPFPEYKIGYWLRRKVVEKIFCKCGQGTIVKEHCYFGCGNKISIGDRTMLGKNAVLGGHITLGDDVIMGPDVVMMANSHRYDRIDIPINRQGGWEKEIKIGNDVWIGTRVIILPGVEIGDHCIIGSGAVVTKSFPGSCIFRGAC